jgi:transposase
VRLLTKTDNYRARHLLIEGAWTYRFSARSGETLRGQLTELPLSIRSIARKAQVRLCAAIVGLLPMARRPELAAFLFAIGQQLRPQPGHLTLLPLRWERGG